MAQVKWRVELEIVHTINHDRESSSIESEVGTVDCEDGRREGPTWWARFHPLSVLITLISLSVESRGVSAASHKIDIA